MAFPCLAFKMELLLLLFGPVTTLLVAAELLARLNRFLSKPGLSRHAVGRSRLGML